MSSILPVGQRDYTHFWKLYYDHKDEGGQNASLSKTLSRKLNSSIADPLPTSFPSSLGSSPHSSSTSFSKLLEVGQTLSAIEKEPETASQKTLDGLLATLLNIETTTSSSYPASVR